MYEKTDVIYSLCLLAIIFLVIGFFIFSHITRKSVSEESTMYCAGKWITENGHTICK